MKQEKILSTLLIVRVNFSVLALIMLLLFAVMPVQAYDQPWNGYREDITGPKPPPQDHCEGDECPPCPGGQTRSPVFVADGALIWQETDITPPGISRVGLKRVYNSFDYRAGLFGRGWISGQEAGLVRTYKAVDDNSFMAAPIFKTKEGVRYTLAETETTCTVPGVLFFSFKKLPDGGFKQVFEDSNSYNIYDSRGAILESYSDKDGSVVYYQYDNQQRLVSQQDNYGNRLTFSYNEQGFVSTVEDGAGRQWHYLYDTFGRLEKMIDPDGNSRDYAYQTIDHIGYKQHLLTDVKNNLSDPVLQVSWTEITLNAGRAMRVSRYVDAQGQVHDYRYQDTTYGGQAAVQTTKTTRQVNANAIIRTQTFIADAKSYLVLQESDNRPGEGTRSQSRIYDERGKLVEYQDIRGNIIRYEYNGAGRPVKITELADTPEEKIITKSYFNGTDRVEVVNEYGLREIRYQYDDNLRVTQMTQVDLETGESRVLKYSYHANKTDSQGNLILGKLASIDGPQSGTQDTWFFTYNSQNRLTRVDLPNNLSIGYRYDAAGLLKSDTDINGIVTERSYDSKNRLTRLVRNGRTQQFAYTADGQIASMTDELGRTTGFRYNLQDKLEKITYPSGDYVQIAYQYATNYTEVNWKYYRQDNTLIQTLVSRLDPVDDFTEQEYLENSSKPVNQYQRNAQNDIIRMTRTGSFGSSTESYRYDRLGQLTRVIDGLNGETAFAYDLFNRLVQVTDPNRGTTRYDYTALDDLLQQTSPDSGVTQFQYDSAGNVIAQTNANHVTVSYQYDGLNRITQMDYSEDPLDTTLFYDRGSNGKGRLRTVNDGSGSSQYRYDDRGLVTHVTADMAGTTLETGYQYNAAGQLTGITYPSGMVARYHHDAAGRLSQLQIDTQGNSQTLINHISWQGSGMESLQYGNGLQTDYNYDGAGRLTGKQFGAANSLSNQLDNQSQITHQTWVHDGNTSTARYQYDKLGRLTYDGTDNNQFRYDGVGNRLSETNPNSSYRYQTASNRLIQAGSRSIQRDAAGNTLDDGIRQYQYNAMNRLSQVDNSQNNTQARYTYNYLGQRTRKQVSGSQTKDIRFVYGLQGELLGEYHPDGQPIREYLYHTEDGIPELVAEITGNGDILYIHTDHLGTPRLATDQNQTVVWRWDSNAFGHSPVNDDPDGDGHPVIINHRFPGQYHDAETGLYYNYQRYYDPQAGRYITSDPIGLAGGLNTYAYVANNPLFFVDPTGETPWGLIFAGADLAWQLYQNGGNIKCVNWGSIGLNLIGGGLLNALGKGAFRFKTIGSHTWGATRSWMNRRGIMMIRQGQNRHHWLLERNQGIGRFFPDIIKNQPWNTNQISAEFNNWLSRRPSLAWLGGPSWAGEVAGGGALTAFGSDGNNCECSK